MRIIPAMAITSILLLAGCATASPSERAAEQLDELRTSIADGTECYELFDMFKQIDESSDSWDTARGEMVNVGCFSRDSERSDGDLADAASEGPWLGVPGETVTPSAACLAAAKAAAAETDSTKADPLIIATYDACESVNEWMSVLALHPGMMGLSDGYIPKLSDLELACYSYVETAVCKDALALGLKVGPQ